MSKKSPWVEILSLIAIAIVTAWSAVHPYDRFTWWLESFPVFLAVPVLLATFRRFRFTTVVYVLIALHAIVLLVGGHYTYARVPLFDWLQGPFHFRRNHFDRLGHFMQGFVPAMIGRELLLRTSPLKRGKWLFILVTACCLAISALYEIFEWRIAVATGSASDDFLGTQGDPWDTQWDMTFALFGAIAAPALLSRLQDRQLQA